MDYINILKKRLNILIALVIGCAIICICMVLFYHPANPFDKSKVDELKAQRQALVQQRAAFETLKEQQIENITYFMKRDSIINSKLDLNIAEIKKVHNDEKINAIHNYNSADIVRAFAELKR